MHRKPHMHAKPHDPVADKPHKKRGGESEESTTAKKAADKKKEGND